MFVFQTDPRWSWTCVRQTTILTSWPNICCLCQIFKVTWSESITTTNFFWHSFNRNMRGSSAEASCDPDSLMYWRKSPFTSAWLEIVVVSYLYQGRGSGVERYGSDQQQFHSQHPKEAAWFLQTTNIQQAYSLWENTHARKITTVPCLHFPPNRCHFLFLFLPFSFFSSFF